MQRRDDIHVLRLGLEALRLFNAADSLGTGEVATALRSSRATAFRVIQTLAHLGYVVPVSAKGRQRYRQAVKVLGLSQGFNGERRLVHVAQPLMMAHTGTHGWPLSLVIPAGDRLFVRLTTDHAAPRALTRRLAGSFEPLRASASGLVCLANRSELVQAALIRGFPQGDPAAPGLEPYSTNLGDSLRQVRQRGFAEHQCPDDRERTLAIPIHLDGAFIAALCQRYMVVAAGGRFEQARRLASLRELGHAIEAGMTVLQPFGREPSADDTTAAH